MKVRRAEIRDIPEILNLLVQVDMVHHEGRPDIFRGPATKYSEQQLAAIISDEKTPVFVCVDEADRVLGHAFTIHQQITGHPVMTDIQTLYIDDICVDEKARGHHVGTALYHHVEQYARENGFYNITLNVWACNPEAMKFYRSLGLETQKIGMEKVLK
ncbi:MAG: GNAT family N-acetyltransferase [Erysipelotrichaceae bacterium]|nr:GNAT family N-acetyltransferase [Erysipelotrichaceae bacterium]